MGKKAEKAGAQYAQDQIESDYFMQWVYEQLVEANRMDPSDVLPLETKRDAEEIAHNMLRDLEHDTKRDLSDYDISRLVGADVSREDVKAFYEGFRDAAAASLDWLADELLELNAQIRGEVREGRRWAREAQPIGRSRGRRAAESGDPWRGQPRRPSLPDQRLIDALAAKVVAIRRERRITFEQAYDASRKPDWLRRYWMGGGDKIYIENLIINRAKQLARRR